MQIILEDRVPYHTSRLFRIHDAYFGSRGGAAWSQNEIPSLATSSYAMARQQAKLLVAHVRSLGREGPVAVLEVGSGSGKFAASLLRALERGCGEGGRALLARLRYVLSDYSRANLDDAARTPDLAPHVASGRVVTAFYDLRKPRELVLDGPVDAPFVAAIANYVGCVTPPVVVRKSKEGVAGRTVTVTADTELRPGETEAQARERVEEELIASAATRELLAKLTLAYAWAPLDLEKVLPDASHKGALAAVLGKLRLGQVQHPAAFLDFVRALRERLVPRGLLVVSDYGALVACDLEGERERPPVNYGNTFNHGFDFPVLEEFSRLEKLAFVRTRNPLSSVHTAAIRFEPELPEEFRRAFARIHVKDDAGQSLLELRAAAEAAAQRGDPTSAASLLRRCVHLDPGSPELRYKLGEACFEAGHPRLALRHLRRGRVLDERKELDFDFLLGRVHVRLGRAREARRAFQRSLAREDNPSTHANLARALELLGDRAAAFQEYRRALELDPEGPIALAVLKTLVADYFPRLRLEE